MTGHARVISPLNRQASESRHAHVTISLWCLSHSDIGVSHQCHRCLCRDRRTVHTAPLMWMISGSCVQMHLFKVGRRQGDASSVRFCDCALSVWRWVILLPSMLQMLQRFSAEESPRHTRPRPRARQQGCGLRTLIILDRRLLDIASRGPGARGVGLAAGVAGAPCRARRLVRSALLLRDILHGPTPLRQVPQDSTTLVAHVCRSICTKRESSLAASRLALLSRCSSSCVCAHIVCTNEGFESSVGAKLLHLRVYHAVASREWLALQMHLVTTSTRASAFILAISVS